MYNFDPHELLTIWSGFSSFFLANKSQDHSVCFPYKAKGVLFHETLCVDACYHLGPNGESFQRQCHNIREFGDEFQCSVFRETRQDICGLARAHGDCDINFASE